MHSYFKYFAALLMFIYICGCVKNNCWEKKKETKRFMKKNKVMLKEKANA